MEGTIHPLQRALQWHKMAKSPDVREAKEVQSLTEIRTIHPPFGPDPAEIKSGRKGPRQG
jgi:hypothetical protein